MNAEVYLKVSEDHSKPFMEIHEKGMQDGDPWHTCTAKKSRHS